MRGVEASIQLDGLGVSQADAERKCIMLMNPDIFIHGTREEFAELVRLISEKAGLNG